MIVLGIAAGGGIGAMLRWLIDVSTPRPSGFPVGITIVNVLGSLLLGVVVGLDVAADSPWITPVTVGVLGGFTTYSTWMADIDQASDTVARAATLLIPLVLGLSAAAVGLAVGVAIG